MMIVHSAATPGCDTLHDPGQRYDGVLAVDPLA